MHKIFEQENQLMKRNLEELYQEIDRLKIKHEKQIIELNNELDRLRTNGKFSLLNNNYFVFFIF